MISQSQILGVLLAGVLGGATLVAEEAPVAAQEAPKVTRDVQSSIRDSVNRHTVGFLEKETQAEAQMRQGNQFFNDGEYIRARDLYIDAKKRLIQLNSTSFKEQIANCDEKINLCYYNLAESALSKADASAEINDYDEAIRLCKEAMDYYPACRAAMEKRIERYTQIRKTIAIQTETSVNTLIPDKATKEYEIQVRMRRGREYAAAGLYLKGKRMYEEVLLLDPYRADALQNLKAMNTYIAEMGIARQGVSQRKAMAINELEWSLPIRPVAQNTTSAIERPIEKVDADKSMIQQKLNAIIIPEIDFDEVNLSTLLEYLRSQSRENDPEQLGVNIFLRRGTGDATAVDSGAPVGNRPGGMPGGNFGGNNENAETATEETSSAEEGLGGKKITLNIAGKSLEESLKALCNAAGLRYRIEKYAVVIEDMNLPESSMETKIFPLDAAALGDAGNIEDPAALRGYFERYNVKFPIGSKIVFDSKISRVIATNTLDNLNKIETICDDTLNTQEPLVQLQVRIIEVSQKDLNALGFNYTLSNSGSSVPAFQPIDTTQFLRQGPANAGGNFTFGEFSLGVSISAINNLNSKDVLASPRVTTLPGQEVRIRLISETYFVEDYDEPELNKTTSENGDINYTYIGPFPNFESDPTPLGIDFAVTPTVDIERRLITMPLAPSITALVGWTEYEGYGEEGEPLSLKTPILSERSVNTNVTVSDGDTIVLGGIVQDNVTTIKDKIPIIGDIPMIGRLFQSRATSSEKSNMLIFITPRLVKPDGTAFYPDSGITNKGVATFF